MSLSLFTAMTIAVCLAPGPNVMLVIGFALKQGVAPAVRAIIGISIINVVYLTLAALGLVAVVVSSAPLFAALRYCGAAYLIYLGYQLVRAGLFSSAVEPAPASKQTRPLLQGILTHLGNPKGVLYWSALLPQFLDPARSLPPQIAGLGTIAVLIDFSIMLIYALIFASASRFLHGSRYFRWVETCAGVFFILSGVLLGAERFGGKSAI